ncbi:MAG: carboxymuconolactone decarboxylase family protein [Candidatus Binataceae bacterium]
MAALVKRFRNDPDYVNGLKIFAHKPEFAEIAWSAYTQLLDHGRLSRELKELVRIKLARDNDCSPYAVKGNAHRSQSLPVVSAAKIAEIDNYEVSEILSRREKLALKFADKLGSDQRALDQPFFTLLRQEFSDPEIVELAHVAAMGVGFERFIAVWAPRVCAL